MTCDSLGGQCLRKPDVMGKRHFLLPICVCMNYEVCFQILTNLLMFAVCDCDVMRTVAGVTCDSLGGQCLCKLDVMGKRHLLLPICVSLNYDICFL